MLCQEDPVSNLSHLVAMQSRISPIDGDLATILKEKFTSEFRSGYVTVDGVCLPEHYRRFADDIEEMEVRDDDVWVCSFPKTGTTWSQEMIWCIANDLDYEGGKVLLSERFPFLDFSFLFDYETIVARTPGLDLPESARDSVKFVKTLASPRFIKTHLPFGLLPRQIRTGAKKPKIVYVARNAKDTCVSYYHHCKLLEGYRGSFQEFCSLFLGNKVTYAPFWDHLLGFWNERERENVMILKYENMKADLTSVILKIVSFLGKVLTDEQVSVLREHLSFASMKSNPAVNYEEVIELNKKFRLIEHDGKFMRSGDVDQWKGSMPSDVIEEFDRWTKENLRDTGFSF